MESKMITTELATTTFYVIEGVGWAGAFLLTGEYWESKVAGNGATLVRMHNSRAEAENVARTGLEKAAATGSNIITNTDQWSTIYTSDDSTMATQAFNSMNGDWWVFVNGRRDIHKFDTRVQAEDYAKTVLAVHLTLTPDAGKL